MAINKRLIKSNDEGPTGPVSFNTVLYTGNQSTQSITGVGFQPDFIWIKERTSTSAQSLFDSVRGINKALKSNTTEAEDVSNPYLLTSFNSDGFSLGDNNQTNEGSQDYVAWCWKAAGFANNVNILENGVVSNYSDATSAGLVSPTGLSEYKLSVNRDSGFSIVKGTASATPQVYPHGLSNKPKISITKAISGVSSWYVNTDIIDGSFDWLFLDATSAAITSPDYFNTTSQKTGWGGGTEFLLYSFEEIAGFSKFGSYSGNSSSFDVNVGFEPSFLMIKSTNNPGNWLMLDNKRGSGSYLKANLSDQEFTSAAFDVPFTANGFTIPAPLFVDEQINEPGWEYIYMAFA